VAVLPHGGIIPAKHRTADELRRDLTWSTCFCRLARSIPRIYLEADKKVERNAISSSFWHGKIGQSKYHGMDLPDNFSHPKAADGFTLAHRDEGIRKFWIEHCIACRRLANISERNWGRLL